MEKPPEYQLTADGVVIQREIQPGLYLVQTIGKATILEWAKAFKEQDNTAHDLQRSLDIVRDGGGPRNLKRMN